MNFEPQKFFIGLIDFFSILLPGALLTYFMMDVVGPTVLPDRYPVRGPEGFGVFLMVSYLFGHLLFLAGSLLFDDYLYDRLRRQTQNKQIFNLAHRGELLPWFLRALIWDIFKHERDLAVDRAGKIKEETLKSLGAATAINTFQWSKAFLAKEHSEGLAAVHRFEADSKFFRSFVIVLILLIAKWLATLRFPLEWRQVSLPVAGIVLLLFALFRYMEQRYKATNHAYWAVISLMAREGKLTLPKRKTEKVGATQAGGVVCRMKKGERPKYLLVQDKKDPKQWVLPKADIEDGEHPKETAVRAVLDGCGVWAAISADLGTLTCTPEGMLNNVNFFLMEYRSNSFDKRIDRRLVWLPIEEAVKLALPFEEADLLRFAHYARDHSKGSTSSEGSTSQEGYVASSNHSLLETRDLLQSALVTCNVLVAAEQERSRLHNPIGNM